MHPVPDPGAGIQARRGVAGSEGHSHREVAGVRRKEGRESRPVVGPVVEGNRSSLADGDVGPVEERHMAVEGIGLAEGDIEKRHEVVAGVADSPGADHLEALAVRILRWDVLLSC
jgi:hypothetical protein